MDGDRGPREKEHIAQILGTEKTVGTVGGVGSGKQHLLQSHYPGGNCGSPLILQTNCAPVWMGGDQLEWSGCDHLIGSHMSDLATSPVTHQYFMT